MAARKEAEGEYGLFDRRAAPIERMQKQLGNVLDICPTCVYPHLR
jgi:hypothetical protein